MPRGAVFERHSPLMRKKDNWNSSDLWQRRHQAVSKRVPSSFFVFDNVPFINADDEDAALFNDLPGYRQVLFFEHGMAIEKQDNQLCILDGTMGVFCG